MELILQNPSPDHATPESYFSGTPDTPPEVRAEGQLMLDLLAHLRQEVAGPALLVHLQMFGLWFTHPDLGGHIRIEPIRGRYQISCAVPLSWVAWHSTTLISSATTVKEVTQKLFAAFEHQPTPQEWKQDVYYDWWDTSLSDLRNLRPFAANIVYHHGEQQRTLDAYYHAHQSVAARHTRERAASMLDVLALMLDQTSRNTLWAHPNDWMDVLLTPRPDSSEGVTIRPGPAGYHISYPFRSARVSWSDAILEHHGKNPREAVHLITLGMEHITQSAAGATDGA